MACLSLGLALLSVPAGPALAQTLSLDLGQGGGVAERALQLIAVITVLSLAPSILIMVTSFTRIAVVLSLLRFGAGHADGPAQCRDHRPLAVPDRFRDGSDPAARSIANAITPLIAGQIQPDGGL